MQNKKFVFVVKVAVFNVFSGGNDSFFSESFEMFETIETI